MNIKTKFDVGQTVYCEYNRGIKKKVIKKITITFEENYNKILYEFYCNWYNLEDLKKHDEHLEEELYETKEEVKKIVIDRIMDL